MTIDTIALEKFRAAARARTKAHRDRAAGLLNGIALDKDEEAIVKRMTKKQKITRAQFIRNLIRAVV